MHSLHGRLVHCGFFHSNLVKRGDRPFPARVEATPRAAALLLRRVQRVASDQRARENGGGFMIAAQLSLDEAIQARDEAIAQVNANADDWAKATVDQAILALAALRPTSANDLRDKLPEIGDRSLIGARFRSLLMRKRLVNVGEVVSTDVGTHAKKIGLYVAVTQ